MNTKTPAPDYKPCDPFYADRVRASFKQQPFMDTLGARLSTVSAGEVAIDLPFQTDLCQQDGFLHAGVVTTIVDNACGYAAFTLMPPDARVLTIEFKVNLLSPAIGKRFKALGRVVKAGRQVTICQGDVVALVGDEEKLVATMLATMMTVRDDPGKSG